jgi:5-methylcytosine-specific restriction protein B
MDDVLIVDKLANGLVYLEENIGDQLRQAIMQMDGNIAPLTTGHLNQILFGPPGTGKTYNTVNTALEIVGEEITGLTRKQVKDLFDAKMKEGQIVFTTFHQSMSYEDFIEGIKPIEPDKEGDPVIYRVEYGIFRNLCIEAAFNIAQLRETKTTEEVLDFSILYDQFAEDINEKLLNGDEVELDTKSGGSVVVESISQQGNIIVKHHQGTRTYTVSKPRLTKLQSVITDLDDVSNINDQFREIIGGSNSSAYWSVLNAIRKEKKDLDKKKEKRTYTFEEKKEVVNSLSKDDFKGKNGKPFVLIVDEINRGNVSQIFGELITLIEEDKRLGKDEAIQVKLPYSKETFGVPPNLYIIGTMNTADRSVEALDTALRRRFSFVEKPPISTTIATDGKLKDKNGFLGEVDLPLLLDTINKRIIKLLDKDHQIGHSYFMSVGNLEDLKSAFHNKIVPLLQEYFFGDYGKAGLVLGEGFFEPREDEDENLFADFNGYDASEFAERPLYKVKNVTDMSDPDFIEAIKTLIKK